MEELVKVRISGQLMVVEKMVEKVYFLGGVQDDSLNYRNSEGVYRWLLVHPDGLTHRYRRSTVAPLTRVRTITHHLGSVFIEGREEQTVTQPAELTYLGAGGSHPVMPLGMAVMGKAAR